jgi:hypothetical protein
MISPWRVRWAERENARRRGAAEAWRHADADLRAMRATAASFAGHAGSGFAGIGGLLPGERVYLSVAGARPVDAPRVAAIPPPDAPFTPPSAPTGVVPAGITVGGPGTALVTSRRLLFLGAGATREWHYESLTGRLDDVRAPFTLLTGAGMPPSGVLVPPEAATAFRFNLRLAVADAYGERTTLVAQMDQFIAWHRQQRPGPPAPADPTKAPASAWWSPLKATAVGVVTLALLFCVTGLLVPSSPAKPTDTHAAA